MQAFGWSGSTLRGSEPRPPATAIPRRRPGRIEISKSEQQQQPDARPTFGELRDEPTCWTRTRETRHLSSSKSRWTMRSCNASNPIQSQRESEVRVLCRCDFRPTSEKADQEEQQARRPDLLPLPATSLLLAASAFLSTSSREKRCDPEGSNAQPSVRWQETNVHPNGGISPPSLSTKQSKARRCGDVLGPGRKRREEVGSYKRKAKRASVSEKVSSPFDFGNVQLGRELEDGQGLTSVRRPKPEAVDNNDPGSFQQPARPQASCDSCYPTKAAPT